MNNTSVVPYLLCETANSHAGVESALSTLIALFAALDYPRKGIKFQVFGADTIALPDFDWYPAYQELEFDNKQWHRLIVDAVAHGDVWIDVFDLYSVEIIRENIAEISGLKLQASVLENHEVLEALRSINLDGKWLIINVSGFDLDHVFQIVELFSKLSNNLILQVGFQGYPTAIEDAAFQKIPILRAAFPQLTLSMSDHADGGSDFAQLAPLYAHALGCTLLEKHICVDRLSAKYDGFSALHFEEMRQLCQRLKELCAAKTGIFIANSEMQYLEKSVQVPILKSALNEGDLVALADVVFRRTAQKGISWQQLDRLQRKKNILRSEIPIGHTVNESDFRPARVAAIVACRMKSSRLLKKATLPLFGVPSVERCLYQCLAMQSIHHVILATSTLEDDRVLENYCCEGKVDFWRGDPDDVISRYLGACQHFGIDVVVRVTADCPAISTEIAEYLLNQHFASGADYTATDDAAVGTAAEIINVSALRKVTAMLGRAEYSEYMTWYFRNNADIFRVNIVGLPSELIRPYRLTLDYQEDFILFDALYTELGADGAKAVALSDIFRHLDARPELASVNSHIQLKYKTDQGLISLLNERTRIRGSS
jgi:N,N'-diacetyllegionaminate synthase